MLGRDNSSHDHPTDPLMWIHPQGTRGLGPTNPQIMIVDLHIHLMGFILSKNHMILGRLPIKYYIQVYKN